MSTDVLHGRLSQIFAKEAAATVAAAAATATAAAASDADPAGHLSHQASSVAPSLTYSESGDDRDDSDDLQPSSSEDDPPIVATPRRRRASTRLIAQSAADIQRITGESSAQLINRCCGDGGGSGCCLKIGSNAEDMQYEHIHLPDNDAFRSLQLKVEGEIPTTITNVADMPEQTTFLLPVNALYTPPAAAESSADQMPQSLIGTETASSTSTELTKSTLETKILDSTVSLGDLKLSESPKAEAVKASMCDEVIQGQKFDTSIQPPLFVQPHPPFHVFPARIHNTRELTKPGAEKRTYHFDLDVTDYPTEETTEFRVGGAIGIMAPNDGQLVDEILDLLMVPRFLRNKPVLLRTTKGRWPTVWGDDKPRELVTTRRDLLTWCSDIQSRPPTKALLRVMAEHATDEDERKLLLYLCSAEGQGSFCDFRTGPHVSLQQMLHAFPSAKPPMDQLLSILQPQMPRFYSLSNDPHETLVGNTESGDEKAGSEQKRRRLIEIAVTVHETSDWQSGTRTGTGSGFFERQALAFMAACKRGEKPELYVPMFKGLMANPLAKQFVPDGPMLLIGAGVGIAPFRGFVQRRLKTANCANKVWVLQGIRDSLVDELYSGEWGVHEDEVKRVVESRRGRGRYVQEEVRHQADLVWFVINSVDGRVFVCGSTRGMGEGVYEALIDVAMQKGNLGREEARKFWELKQEVGQYIAETW